MTGGGFFHGRRGKRPRGGTIYIVVLGAALIVSVLGLSALMIHRLQRRAYEGTSDAVEARLHAQAALRIGMLRIQKDPDWRHVFPNGVWEADVPWAGGSYTLAGIDPSDNDIADNAADPLVLIGTGKKGTAVQKMQVTLAPENRGCSCLEVAMHASKKVRFETAVVQCDQTISANDDVEASSSVVNSDVEAVDQVTGYTYTRTTKTGIDPRQLPDSTTVFDYYKDHGTWIDISSLPTGFSNVLKNSGIENGATYWAPWEYPAGYPTCQIARDTTQYHGGAGSLKVTNRFNYQAGPIQDLTGVIQSGVTYDCLAWVKMTYFTANVHFVIEVTSSGSGFQWWASSDTEVRVSDGWKQVSKTLTPVFSGTVLSALLKVETKNGNPVTDFYVDDLLFKESGSDHTIYRQVLSPASNPFGAAVNPEGIYVIDCHDQKLVIKGSRIVGTLVLLAPKTDSVIGSGPLCWEPAVPGYPALLVEEKEVTIQPSDGGLVESALSVNFNPPGTPHEATGEDGDLDDTYLSQIEGLIYSEKQLTLRNHPVIKGAVVGNDEIVVQGKLDLVRNPAYARNPPPGFSGPEEIKILLDSAVRVVD